ncbi:ABC transporter [Heterobasidion irregulare TC 32-1]|uniref:ABC transporter n=1 Tax=Heterobasidion irregulare (strain TC 32-1) TaxID=747525 RepID=W4K568_HETIT|nr:ABC transporter [Heterobasidion irregulare TC 32-1]ETW80963.1 ABC transporter [Heterobasidion irregulare TC 32-1]
MLPHPAIAQDVALFALRIVSPALVLLSTLSIVPTRPASPASPSPITPVVVATRTPRRALILSLLSLSSLTYLLDGLAFVIFAVIYKKWPYNSGIEVNAVLGLVAFAGLAALGAWKDVKGVDVWSLKRLKAAIALSLILDIAQVVLYGASIPDVSKTLVFLFTLLHLVFPAFRVLLLVPLFFAFISPRVTYSAVSVNGAEPGPTSTSLLLPPEAGASLSTGLNASPVDGSKYGTFRSTGSTNLTASGPTTRAHTPDPASRILPLKPSTKEKEINLDPSWGELWTRLRRITPYLWPSKSRGLQMIALLCILTLVIGRFINFAVPVVLAKLVSIFEKDSTRSPWPWVFGYVGLRFLQSSGGLAALRDALWAPVMQYSDREMSQLSFNHLLNLSFAFHTRRKTGEVLRILDRGAAINHTLELILFSVLPTFVDIIVALVVFTIKLDWTVSIVIFFVMFTYVAASVGLTRWRTQLRRQMNDRDIITRGIHTDCLLNYETVKYFNGEEHEGERYRDALLQYQALEYRVMLSLNLLNLVQNFIITVGLLVGTLIVAQRVTVGTLKASDFVFFITYLAQLYGPLNSLGYIYRSINQSLVDTEKLLKLLNEPTEINDKPNAPDLLVGDGEIEFENVNFSYDGRTTALKGVSFKVPKGSSVALVGESGSGKSTILRLLYRFYDLQEGEGRIAIDGQDIRDITQASLRKAIGVVPQDSVLFNATIAYNIGYGKFGASQEELEEAAKAAQMHDRILSFPDGYETKVGERGIRLSGGEKQRVAIARTLLKNPPILLLDEATSALDTSTERDIQKALQNLVQGRSSLSIAHRLSTIASADLILVLKDGQIVEQGSHKELLEQNGIFASMWADQISASEDPEPSLRKDVVSGYSIENDGSVARAEDSTAIGDVTEDATAEISDVVQVDAQPTEIAIIEDPPIVEGPAVTEHVDAPIAFPMSDAEDSEPIPVSSPIAFPISNDDTHRSSVISDTPIQSPGVTFVQGISTPPRSGTPDPESEPKRKRISSQNFQRLARRISITTRRQGSASSIPIPGFIRDASFNRSNTHDDSASKGDAGKSAPKGEAGKTTDSPAPSIQSENDKNKKKEKKDKKKRKSLM